ncbi:MAG: hypothetical protein O3A74_06755, partial [archaeon]|nr:hypothetical protein [archaeon]
EGTFSIVLFIIALGSISFGLWSMVMRRRFINESFEDNADQTSNVEEAMNDGGKVLPDIVAIPPPTTASIPPPQASVPPPIPQTPAAPPLPPSGLPEGWTMDQWNAYGWQYLNSLKK